MTEDQISLNFEEELYFYTNVMESQNKFSDNFFVQSQEETVNAITMQTGSQSETLDNDYRFYNEYF